MKTTKKIEKLKVTVKRPSGKIEHVYRTEMVKTIGLNKEVQQKCINDTKKAGSGDILKFEIITETVDMTFEEQREDLVFDINNQICFQDEARERDFDNDIGFHLSPKFDKIIANLRIELKQFDEKHPEIIAEIKRVQAKETERQIQSALNA